MMICVTCGLVMRCAKTGATVHELDDRGEAYKLWAVDVFECRACGHLAAHIDEYRRAPLSEHYQEGHAERAAALKASQGAWFVEVTHK